MGLANFLARFGIGADDWFQKGGHVGQHAQMAVAGTNLSAHALEHAGLGLQVDVREFGSLSTSNDNSALFAAAVAGVPVGSTIFIPPGSYPGSISINRDYVNISGGGKPIYNGSAMVGGTIIKGAISAYSKGVTISNLGVDQSATADTDGIVSGYGDETAFNDNYFYNISILGRGYANGSLHGVITQAGGRVYYDRISVYKFGHGQVIRCREGHISRGYVEDADLDAYIFKSADTFPANNCYDSSLTDCVARAPTSGKRANLIIQGDTAGYLTRNIVVNGFYSEGSSEKAVQFIGTAGTVRDVTLNAITVAGCTATRAFAFEGGANITAIGCNVYDAPAYSYGGDGASGVRLIGCVSRGPTAGHRIGTFGFSQINGKVYAEPGVATDDPPFVLQSGTLANGLVNGGLEFDGTFLYFTVGGVRKKITMA